MNIKKTFVRLAFAVGSLASLAVYAWNIQEDRGNTVLIRCGDGSNSTVAQSDGYWTVISAGKKGTTGGRFAIVGQAALKGCGE
jgi:hypothetical protein